MSQNIRLFCAATGLATRSRAVMNNDFIQSVLKLDEGRFPILNRLSRS